MPSEPAPHAPSPLDHPVLNARYFFPRADAPTDTVSVATGGVTLACAQSRPHPDGPTVVYFHGNGETVADCVPWFPDALARAGANAFLVEYRGYGRSTGTPSLEAMLDDVDAVVRATGTPVERLIAFGRSIGSLYALELAHRHPGLGALVLESGIADVLERALLRVRPEEIGATQAALAAAVARRFDHRAKLAGFHGRLLVLHARRDTLVDVTHGERLFAWAATARKRLVVCPHGDHNSILEANHELYWSAVRALIAGEAP